MRLLQRRKNLTAHLRRWNLARYSLIIAFSFSIYAVNVVASTQIWKVNNQLDFLLGTPEGTSISSDGKISLSPLVDTLFLSGELYIWSLASDGQNIFAGTGNDGKIFKITPDGNGQVFVQLEEEVEIWSLALDQNGILYAGTGPGGKVFKITQDGKAQLFFESGESYIWSLVFHQNGNLYAGTGENGKIYAISKDGKGEVLYDSEEEHILILKTDGRRILAGTSSSGLLFEINPDGAARVLYDTPHEEIRGILKDREGNLWIGATTPEDKSGEFSIYRVSHKDEMVYPVVSIPYLLLSMSMDRHGNLLVGTGEESLLEVNPNGEWKLLLEVPASQILQLVPWKDQMLIGTGDLGNLYRIRARYRKEGDYISRVYDAVTHSKWGVIQWEGEVTKETKIFLQTRSGNAENVEGTWSSWSEPFEVKSNPLQGVKIESPPARFLQWRARLRTRHPKLSPFLKEVRVAFLQNNLPPRINSITLYPSGVGVGKQIGKRKAPSLPSKRREELKSEGYDLPPGSFILERGSQSIGWKGEDDNGDSLVYSLYFRGEDEKRWKILRENVPDENLFFDTRAFPDGRYEIRVVAKDTPNNPETHALAGEKTSEVFTIDNTPPRVDKIKAKSTSQGKYTITFEVEDETSTLRECSYALNGQEWKPLYPSDDVFDTSLEAFQFNTESLPAGEHTLVIKAEDIQENVGAGKIILK